MQNDKFRSAPLTLLLSERAQQEFGERIGKTLQGVPYRLMDLNAPKDAMGNFNVDIAFLSRDVTADSGKQKLASSLVRFYEMIERSPSLQWLQTHAAGADRPIYGQMRQRGVSVTTASGANAVPVAQMAVTGMLLLARRFPELLDAQRRKAWEPLLNQRAPRDLAGQTAVVVGLGPIGLEIARLLKALNMKVVGVRRSRSPCLSVDETVPFEGLTAMLPKADWVFLACPLTDQTRGLLNRETLNLLSKEAGVINVSRGEVIVEADLIEALQVGQIGKAYLDVLVNEPLDTSSALWDMPNVIISPHTAGHTLGHYAAVGDIFLNNLECWRGGMPLINAID
ncbi:D-2-hydroxyacid dehydrogenase [Candidimonas sp. SYP-B2681]|uniref:D-2-hydroxyacid dehydrogenase n=1 Tax=Candidimonas sp. SYP-B2681 TaxID=2497686 RepID=UPI000F875B09|nr:D-2-hydroxyacid dehydrogenase [Candidimonas sp. SYP-B2681]RTZ45549.1 D-2-hydroxyacid dehydrogenase [Candidimonas sp. SYP-B2681]